MSSVAVSETASPVEAVRSALARMDAAVGDVLSGLAALAGSGGAGVPEREWRELLSSVERVGRRVDAARLRTIAGASAAGAPERTGFVDTGSWVSKHTGANRPAAASDALVAGALGDGDGEATLSLVDPTADADGGEDSGTDAGSADGGAARPRTPARVALDAGEITVEHAKVIVHALTELPASVDAAGRLECERELVRLAANRTPAQLRKAARRVLDVVEKDTAVVDAHEDRVVADTEDRAREKSAFWIKDNHDGTMTGHFTVPWYSGAALKKIVDAMTAPRRSTRLASLSPVPESSVSHDGHGRDRPSSSPNDLKSSGAGSDGARDPSNAGRANGALCRDTGEGESAGAEWRAEELTWQQKRGLAFADLLQRLPTDHLHPKTAATVIVTVGLDALSEQTRQVAGTDVGDSISAGTVRRLACEAGVIPAVLGGSSVPLDLGRQRRLHTEAQRAALALLYDECAADGCDRPLAWTETHHLTAWRDGGHTRIDDAVPLCGTHHHAID
ncbi:uncharacterized protein DUF222, partial [Knoellia remsis]